MYIDFSKLPIKELKNFYKGEGSVFAKIVLEDKNKIMYGTLPAGASIGEHTHNDNCEMFYVFQGSIKAICDGIEERITAGNLHYCPQGHTHTLINDTDADVLYLSVIPRQ